MLNSAEDFEWVDDVLPVARWFGSDSFEFTSTLGKAVHDQMKILTIKVNDKEIRI